MAIKKKAIIAGHCCLDMTPKFPDRSIKSYEEYFSPGHLVNVGNIVLRGGGVVSNTGLGMHKLGSDVTLIARIAKDAFGLILESQFSESGVDYCFNYDDFTETGYTLALAPQGLDRMFLAYEGSNMNFSNEDILQFDLSDYSLVHFGYPTLLRTYYRQEGKELEDLFRTLKERGILTSMDMTMVDGSSEAGQCDWEGIFKRSLPYVDFFCPSIEEMLFMLDPEKYATLAGQTKDGDILKVLDYASDIKPLADRILNMGCKVLFLKCGVNGIYLFTSHADQMKEICEKLELDADNWSDRSWHQGAFEVDRFAAGTGAGDTSIAAFLTSLLRGYTCEEAMEYASATGAMCVTEYDSLSGLISLEALREKIDAGWKAKSPGRAI